MDKVIYATRVVSVILFSIVIFLFGIIIGGVWATPESSTKQPVLNSRVYKADDAQAYYFGYWQSCMLNNTLENNNGERDRFCLESTQNAVDEKWGEADSFYWPLVWEELQHGKGY